MSESMHLLTGAYALDALDDEERAAFEEHLAGCPQCTAEVRGLLDATARLAAAAAVEPSPALKAAVMAEVARTSQLPALEPTAAGVAAAPAGAVDAEGDGVVLPMRRPGWSWAQRSLATAAAFLAVVAIGLSALLVQSNSARRDLDATQASVTRILTAADAQTLPGAIAGGGRGTVVVSRSQGRSVFVGTGLRQAGAGHTYELWYMTAAGSATRAGTFDPGRDGQVTVLLSGNVGSAATVGLTVEPAGGSTKPTTTPVMAVPLA